MRTFRTTDKRFQASFERWRASFGLSQGATSEESDRRTIRAFGRSLSPREVVQKVMDDVRARGDGALFEYARKLDGFPLSSRNLRVSPSELKAAHDGMPRRFLSALRRARRNVEAFQRHIRPKAPAPLRRGGLTLSLQLKPVRRVGFYAPGSGKGYPSSLLMGVVPAQVAGVSEMAVAVPPTGGEYVLAAAYQLGIKEVYRLRGAYAIAAFAFGTKTVPRVDKIVAPGNTFVALCQKAVFGFVDIDLLPGPSEVVVLADESASAELVAADMVSQAEHQPGVAVLVTDSGELASEVAMELGKGTKETQGAAARASLERYGAIMLTRNLDESVQVVGEIAPEHVEVMTRRPSSVARRIFDAGAVFVGPYAPVPLGDYVAGPSHILPTSGAARVFSGISVYDFFKRVNLINCTKAGLEELADAVASLAEAERLPGHARAVRVRSGNEEQ